MSNCFGPTGSVDHPCVRTQGSSNCVVNKRTNHSCCALQCLSISSYFWKGARQGFSIAQRHRCHAVPGFCSTVPCRHSFPAFWFLCAHGALFVTTKFISVTRPHRLPKGRATLCHFGFTFMSCVKWAIKLSAFICQSFLFSYICCFYAFLTSSNKQDWEKHSCIKLSALTVWQNYKRLNSFMK